MTNDYMVINNKHVWAKLISIKYGIFIINNHHFVIDVFVK